MVGIIRIMIQTLWICRCISVWKRAESLWTLMWAQCFLTLTASLVVRKPGSQSPLLCLGLWPNDPARVGGRGIQVLWLCVEFAKSSFSSPLQRIKGEAARCYGSAQNQRTGPLDSGPGGDRPLLWPHRTSVSLPGVRGRWVSLKGHEPLAQRTNLAFRKIYLAYIIPKFIWINY